MNGKMQRTLRLLHVPAGPCGTIRRRTHQTVSVAPALTMQSDLFRIYNSDWRLVSLRLQTSRSMRVQRPLNVPLEWMAWIRSCW